MTLTNLEETLRSLLQAEGGGGGALWRLLETSAALALLWLIQALAYRFINERIHEVDRRHQARVWVRTAVVVLAAALLIVFWLPNGQTVIQVLALLAAGLALTLSRPISSLLAWLVISGRGTYRVGDRVQLGTVAGDVIDIGLLYTHLLEIGNWVEADQTTGRIAHVPNSTIFDGPVFNFTEGFDLVWEEFTVVLTHDSDWQRARTLLLELAEPHYQSIAAQAMQAADRMARRYAYQRGIVTPYVYISLLRDGVKLSLRYLSEPRRRRGHRHDITCALLQLLQQEPAIRLAPPSYRILSDEPLPPPLPRP